MVKARILAAAAFATVAASCMERADRWYLDDDEPACELGERRCRGALERCVETPRGPTWDEEEDCERAGLVCAPTLLACRPCVPDAWSCDGQTVMRCDAAGQELEPQETCDTDAGIACRDGSCANLCGQARERRSNVGCEYWAVDLDNARIDDTSNAAAQQFAVVLSNHEPDLPTDVIVEQDDAEPGEPAKIVEVLRTRIGPFSQRIVRLGPREVDGSAPGTFNTGTHTALSRGGYRIRSTVPIVAYQFNPLENVNVFSNDASLLKPVEAVSPTGNGLSDAYVVLGWPQTIASTDDPETNFPGGVDLRAFVTIVGTRPATRVRVFPTARVLPGGPVVETLPGEPIDVELEPFDVLNLESDDFNADFTGSIIQADGPVIAFTGSEASDAPYFQTISRRRCCADHLEEQLDPIRTAGKRFVLTVSPNRTQALIAAGARIGAALQPEFFRVLAVTDAGARVTTTLPDELERFELTTKGSFLDLTSTEAFALDSDAPVMVQSLSPSQAAANVPETLPGGDPSQLIVPPIEQFRSNYVFLTPDKYSFDFVRIIATPDARIVFNDQRLEDIDGCSTSALTVASKNAGDGAVDLAETWAVHTCQLSYPVIDPDLSGAAALSPGRQSDGPQFLVADRPVGVLVDGFDAFVSYAYAGGTELEFIVPE